MKKLSQIFKKYTWNTEKAAEALGYNIEYTTFLARHRKIPALKLSGRWFFCEEEIVTHMTRKREKEEDDVNGREDPAGDLLL